MATGFRAPTDSRLMQWRQWWQLRSPAERSGWLGGGIILGAVVAWAFLWQPLSRDIDRLERRVSHQRATLATARRQADEIAKLSRAGVEPATRDAKSDIEAALARQGLKATAIDRSDDARLRVTLEQVSFDALSALVDGLQRDARLSAIELTAAARVEPGQVRAEATFAPPR